MEIEEVIYEDIYDTVYDDIDNLNDNWYDNIEITSAPKLVWPNKVVTFQDDQKNNGKIFYKILIMVLILHMFFFHMLFLRLIFI